MATSNVTVKKFHGLGNQQPSLTNVSIKSMVGHQHGKEMAKCQFAKHVESTRDLMISPKTGAQKAELNTCIDWAGVEIARMLSCDQGMLYMEAKNIKNTWLNIELSQKKPSLSTMAINVLAVESQSQCFLSSITLTMMGINTEKTVNQKFIQTYTHGLLITIFHQDSNCFVQIATMESGPTKVFAHTSQEGSTNIPEGSRGQAASKRLAPSNIKMDDDIFWSAMRVAAARKRGQSNSERLLNGTITSAGSGLSTTRPWPRHAF